MSVWHKIAVNVRYGVAAMHDLSAATWWTRRRVAEDVLAQLAVVFRTLADIAADAERNQRSVQSAKRLLDVTVRNGVLREHAGCANGGHCIYCVDIAGLVYAAEAGVFIITPALGRGLFVRCSRCGDLFDLTRGSACGRCGTVVTP